MCSPGHLPLIITPDDIWLLIIQTFSNHVNENAKELKDLLVNYDGKKQLEIEYPINDIKEITKEILEDFSERMNEEMKQVRDGEKYFRISTVKKGKKH